MKRFVIILSVLLLVGCGNKISDEIPKGAFIDLKLEDIEVFQEMYVTDLVHDTNVKIEDYKLDTDVIGEKDIELRNIFIRLLFKLLILWNLRYLEVVLKQLKWVMRAIYVIV